MYVFVLCFMQEERDILSMVKYKTAENPMQ